jgi:hypothetical protein
MSKILLICVSIKPYEKINPLFICLYQRFSAKI